MDDVPQPARVPPQGQPDVSHRLGQHHLGRRRDAHPAVPLGQPASELLQPGLRRARRRGADVGRSQAPAGAVRQGPAADAGRRRGALAPPADGPLRRQQAGELPGAILRAARRRLDVAQGREVVGRAYAFAILEKVLRTAEQMAPCVLMIDELEKALSYSPSGDSDAGLSKRIFGRLLGWLQDRTAPVFVVTTSNNIAELPPELTRKGRFDEIFFVNLPNA